MSLHHGGLDPYTPTASTLVYRQLRRMNIPAELHLYPDKGHGAFGFDRAVEFMRQMGYMGPVPAEVPIMDVYSSDEDRAEVIRENVWPEGMMPNEQEKQCTPYIEWHIPTKLTTTAIQIIYSGGSYQGGSHSQIPHTASGRPVQAHHGVGRPPAHDKDCPQRGCFEGA